MSEKQKRLPTGGYYKSRPPPSGIPAKGPGWGGPAKGASTTRIKPGDPDGIQALRNDPEVIARKREEAEEVRQMLRGLALDPEQPGMTRVSAGVAFLDRTEGKPVATNVNVSSSTEISALSNEDLHDELTRLERAAAFAASRVREAGGKD